MHRLQEWGAVTALRGAPGATSRRARLLAVASIAVVVVAADQITKSLAVATLSNGRTLHLVGPFSLELNYNTGVAFSLAAGLGLPIVILTLALLALLVWFARGVPSVAEATGAGLTLGGAIGNLSDRIFRAGGAVVDFLHPSFWPTFNLADSAVVLGCGVLALSYLRRKPPTPAQGSGPGASAPERP